MKTSRLLSSRLLWALCRLTALSLILIHTKMEVTPQSDNIPFVIVGSEAILRGNKTSAQIIAYLNQVKQAVSLPVTTSEPWHTWRDNPALGNTVGIICLNVRHC